MAGNKQIKIAISGKARAGKNSVAEMFITHSNAVPEQCKIVALADPMKHIVKIMFPEANNDCLFGQSELRSHIISDKYKDKNGNTLTHRQALIDLGAFGRQYNSNVWINCLVEDAKNNKDKLLYIIADVRFINEYTYLRDAGFYMIRVKRPEYTNIDDISEKEQDAIPDKDFNAIINNSGTLDDLSNTVKSLVDVVYTNKNEYL
jgi:deoxynucleotide monophosphate kinase-like protein